MKMQLIQIVLDESLRARSHNNPIHIHDMVEAYEMGVRFPPMVIERQTRRLVDGWHRHEVYSVIGLTETEVEPRTYSGEAELFADAIRLNISHGERLTSYDIKNAIARLESLGVTRVAISEIVRVPAPKIEKLVRGFAQSADGAPLPLKRGLGHLQGQTLTDRQAAAIKHHGGHEATFYARQVVALLEQDLWPRDNPAFHQAMNDLTRLWTRTPKSPTASAA